MEKLSLEKIAKGDVLEQARLLFTVSPSKFKIMARNQGVQIDTLADAEKLAHLIKEKEIEFNWGKFVRTLPVSNRDIKKARAEGLRIE